MTNMPQPQAQAHWVMKLLDVSFEPASPLTGEVFDLFIDHICALVFSQDERRVFGLPTWRERRDASRTLYACVLSGHIPGTPEASDRVAARLRMCADDLPEAASHCAKALNACATKLESYGAAFLKTRGHTYSDDLQRARRVTRIERDFMSSLLEVIESLMPRGQQ